MIHCIEESVGTAVAADSSLNPIVLFRKTTTRTKTTAATKTTAKDDAASLASTNSITSDLLNACLKTDFYSGLRDADGCKRSHRYDYGVDDEANDDIFELKEELNDSNSNENGSRLHTLPTFGANKKSQTRISLGEDSCLRKGKF